MFSKGGSSFGNRVSLSLSRTSEWTYFYATGKEGYSSHAWEDTVIVAHASPNGAGKDKASQVTLKIINPIPEDGGKISTPAAEYDPATNSGGEGNEFTYTTADVGILRIPVWISASVPDLRAYAYLADRITVQIADGGNTTSPIGSSALTWDHDYLGHPSIGKPTYREDPDGTQYFQAVATFTGLPADNADFGKKEAIVHLLTLDPVTKKWTSNAKTKQTAAFEVFFPRDEKNHPGEGHGETPNWFYYWIQTVDLGARIKAKYVEEHDGARGYTRMGQDYIYLTRESKNPKTIAYSGIPAAGIESFINTVYHECVHQDDFMNFGPTTAATG